MSLFKQFSMDSKKELEGVEISYAPNADGTTPTFIVARASGSNPRYVKALERATRPVRRLIDTETLSQAQALKIRIEVFVASLLIGWKNVQDAKGVEIPFSSEAATSLFKQLPEMFDDLEAQAKKASLYRDETLETEAKN